MFSMKFCDMKFEEVISIENLCFAWSEFIRGKRNKEDVQRFAFRLGDEVVALNDDLASGAYRHGSYHHFVVSDPKRRDIHKASVRDRLLHHAIHRKLYPYFAAGFIADSFSCQTGKGVHRAMDRFRSMAAKASRSHSRTCWVLKCDIRKFFASIDHAKLVDILRTKIVDVRLTELFRHVTQSFEASPGKGIPLGNLTSQLFANVYLNELDQFVKRFLKVEYYVRYADDFVLLSADKGLLVAILPLLCIFLEDRLALMIHPSKVFLKTFASGVDFLGWVYLPHYRVPRTETKERILKRSKVHPTNAELQSYLGLLEHGDAYEQRIRLLNDYWLWSTE